MHVIGHIINGLEHGTALFTGWTASSALSTLRTLLGLIGVEHADKYRCHDIRRGHAVDLQLAGLILFTHVMQVFHDRVSSTGAPLYVILAAGEWRSPAFLDYLDRHALERDVVDQSHLMDALESDDEP